MEAEEGGAVGEFDLGLIVRYAAFRFVEELDYLVHDDVALVDVKAFGGKGAFGVVEGEGDAGAVEEAERGVSARIARRKANYVAVIGDTVRVLVLP